MSRLPAVAVILASLALGACASTFKYAYHDVSPSTTTRTDNSVAVATIDQREYVLSGRSRPDFVGMLRGGYGNTFDVHTESGKPLSTEFSAAIRRALERNGVRVTALETTPGQDERAVAASLAATKSDRKMLLAIKEWISDGLITTELGYDLQLTVADENGRPLAAKTQKDLRNLGGSVVNAVGHAQSAVPSAFQDAVETLLSSPEIAASLN